MNQRTFTLVLGALALTLVSPDALARRRHRGHRAHPASTSTTTTTDDATESSDGNDSDAAPAAGATNNANGADSSAATTTTSTATPPAPPADSTAAAAPAASEAPANAARVPWIDLGVNFVMQGRHMHYTDDLFGQLRTYDLTASPGVSGRIELYPGALLDQTWGAVLGIVAGADYEFVPPSQDSHGMSYPTLSFGYYIGGRLRLPLADYDLGLEIVYFGQRFTIDQGTPDHDAGIPSVGYRGVRSNVNGRIPLVGPVTLLANVGLLFVSSVGPAWDSYFPHSTQGGVEAALGLAVSLGSGLEVRLAADYKHYFFSMNPEPGDPYIAGGALDQYLSATLGVALRR